MNNFDQEASDSKRRDRRRAGLLKALWIAFGWVGQGLSILLTVLAADFRQLRVRCLDEWLQVRRGNYHVQQSISVFIKARLQQLKPSCWQPLLKRHLTKSRHQAQQQWLTFKADVQQIADRLMRIREQDPQNQALDSMSPFADERKTIFAASILINLLALAFPLLMLQMYDRILPHQSIDTLLLFALAVGTAFGLEALTRVVRSHMTAWISARFEQRAMVALAERTLAEPLHQFERKGTGFVLEEFKSISTLKYHYSGQTFQQLMDLPFTVLYVLIAFLISPWIGLLLAGGYAAFIYWTWKNGREDPVLIKAQKEGDLRRAPTRF